MHSEEYQQSTMAFSTFRRLLLLGAATCSVLLAPELGRAQVDPAPLPDEPGIEPAKSEIYYGIGLNASLLSGAGLSARMMIGERYGVQLTTFVLALNSLTHFNIGVEGQYTFTQGEVGRLYGLVGGGYYLTTKSDTTKPGNRIAEPARLGLGVGGDLYMVGNLAVDGSLAFHWFMATGKVLPLPSIGFHYYFR